MAFRDLFPRPGAVIGMVHLLPLPGSPGWAGSMDAVFDRACADARTWAQAGADALVISGAATGRPTDPEQLRRVRAAMPEAPLCVGSGTTAENVAGLLRCADAVIAGTSAKVGGLPHNPVDLVRAQALVTAARKANG